MFKTTLNIPNFQALEPEQWRKDTEDARAPIKSPHKVMKLQRPGGYTGGYT